MYIMLPNLMHRERKYARRLQTFKNQLELQSMVWPGIIFLFIFCYIPMYGIIISFQDFSLFSLNSSSNIFSAYMNSPWVGFKHFKEFFTDPYFLITLRNTLGINVLGLIIGFPFPVIFALLLNEIRNLKFKKFVQTVTYLPHFVSWVIFGGLIYTMMATDQNGVINVFLKSMGLIEKPVEFLANPDYFWAIVVISSVVKGFGFNSILYIAAIAGVDQEVYDAAEIDGCGRFAKMWYITIPAIMGTVSVMFIFSISGILNTGFDQIIVLQNSLNLDRSETIDTYVYKVGIGQMRYSYSAAVGLAKSVVATLLLFGANYTTKKLTEKSLF
ncbi:MAG: sugar ABC transporter permease [Clostridiaceae bacterium]|nr:sugar ABC transporter permease [Clostridiaceae bacterium]